MTKHNEYGAEAYISGCALEAAGAKTKREGIVLRAKGYGEMLDTILKNSPDGKMPSTNTLAAKLKDILETRGKIGTSNVPISLPDKNERLALDWFRKNPKQVAIVDNLNEGSDAFGVRSLQNLYAKALKAEVKAGLEDGDSPGVIADAMATTVDVVDAIIEKAEVAAKKKAEKEAEEQATPVAEATVDIVHMDPKELLSLLVQRDDAKFLMDAWNHFVTQKAAAAKPEYSRLSSIAEVVEALTPESSTFAVMKGNTTEKAATVRVSRKFSKVSVYFGDDTSAHERSFKGKSISVKLLKQSIMDVMINHGTFPPEGGIEHIGPNTGPTNHTLPFRLFREV